MIERLRRRLELGRLQSDGFRDRMTSSGRTARLLVGFAAAVALTCSAISFAYEQGDYMNYLFQGIGVLFAVCAVGIEARYATRALA